MKDLSALIKIEANRRLQEEAIPRIEKCIDLLTDDEIWQKPNEQSNSIGHLILHLTGNIKQWLVSGLGGAKDIRQRDQEFNSIERVDRKTLLNDLKSAIHDGLAVLGKLDSAHLAQTYVVQVYQETGVSIVIHVIEHCSYHVGQISYWTKYLKNTDLQYYAEDLG